MAQEILNVSQLKVGVEDKEILHGVDLSLNKGETHVLMGPNGAGKSTLGYALMGNPRYEILGGKVTFNGEDLLSKNVAERSQAGLFLSFQNPIEVPGITLGNFIRSSMEQRGKKMTYFKFKKLLQEKMEFLQMDPIIRSTIRRVTGAVLSGSTRPIMASRAIATMVRRRRQRYYSFLCLSLHLLFLMRLTQDLM